MFNHINNQKGSLNLELVLIIALGIIISVSGLTFLGGNISDLFSDAGWKLSGETPTGEINITLIEESTSETLPNTEVAFIPTEESVTFLPIIQQAYATENTSFIALSNNSIIATSDNNGVINTKLPEGTYTIAINERGLAIKNETEFTIKQNKIITLGEIPVVIEPVSTPTATSAISDGKIILNWSDEGTGPIPTQYKVQTATQSDFSDAITTEIEPSGDGNNTFITNSVPQNTNLFVRVQAVSGSAISEWSTAKGYEWKESGEWATIFTDDFNRTNNTTVGNGWAQGTGGTFSVYGINSNQLYIGTSGSYTGWMAIGRATNTSYSRAVSAVFSDLGRELVLYVGRRDYTNIATRDNGYGYAVQVYQQTGLTILRLNGTTSTAIASWGASPPLVAGDVIGIERVKDGSNWRINGLVNGVVKTTAIDNTYMTDSDTAVYAVGANINSNSSFMTTAIDNFTVYEWQVTKTLVPIE